MPENDPQAKWKRPGVQSAPLPQAGQKIPYTAFIENKNFMPRMLQLRRGGNESDRAFQFPYFEEATTDNWSILSSTYCPPHTLAFVLIIRGEFMEPLVSAFMRGTLEMVQVFNPDRHIEPEEDSAIVREIELLDKPMVNTTQH